MRVISGQFKGKRLQAPKDNSVRPTTDRIKETLFNILASKCCIEGANVLDLFCGSGALGIEALSRDAKKAVFIDNSPESIKLTKQNLAAMDKIIIRCNIKNKTEYNAEGINCIAEVFNTSFEVAIKKLQGEKFDIIFIDPPYFDNLGERSLYLIDKHDILSQDGIIAYEHYGKNSLSTDLKKFIIDTRNFGSISVSFLTKLEINSVTSTSSSLIQSEGNN